LTFGSSDRSRTWTLLTLIEELVIGVAELDNRGLIARILGKNIVGIVGIAIDVVIPRPLVISPGIAKQDLSAHVTTYFQDKRVY